MIEEQSNNVINNYKGVMLCSRPNENTSAPVDKPFCGRVFNHEQLGLVPIRKEDEPIREHKKHPKTVLNKHKKWLQEFKEKQNKHKIDLDEKEKKDEEKFKKVREIAENDRERAKKMKNEYNQTATQVLNILDDQVPSRSGELTAANLRQLDESNENKEKKKNEEKRDKDTEELFKKAKKMKRPEWAMTEELKEKQHEEEVDELLNFFNTTEVNEFSADEQVQQILENLKKKIEEIKEKEDWREREANRVKEREQKRRERQTNEEDDDKMTHASGNSEAKSIASERAQKNIDDLKRKKQEKEEWDKHTATSKQSFANIDEKIAKNLADEVLRNYPHLRGVHSNTSIRKLLESEAAKAMNEPILRPVITTIVKNPKPMDANNLPYLHRNPSI